MKTINLQMNIKYDGNTEELKKYDIKGTYSIEEIAVIISAFRNVLTNWGYKVTREE